MTRDGPRAFRWRQSSTCSRGFWLQVIKLAGRFVNAAAAAAIAAARD